jgi:hypothetical protein
MHSQNCRLMYDLPGTGGDGEGGTLVDLIDDEDLEMMWEELDSMVVSCCWREGGGWRVEDARKGVGWIGGEGWW